MQNERKPVFVASDQYRRAAFGKNHPLAIPRVEMVYDLCSILGWMPTGGFEKSPVATIKQLTRFHSRDYVEALHAADAAGTVTAEQREKFHFGTMENPCFQGVFDRASTSVGGSIRAAEFAAEGHTAFHPSGGTHHGRPDRASGFLLFQRSGVCDPDVAGPRRRPCCLHRP